MGRYFYINNYHFNNSKKIDYLTGYYTDMFHNNFLPTEKVVRDKVIELINAGLTFFIEDGRYKRIRLKMVKIDDDIFLRVDCHSAPFDYFG